jgi:hypothetical protein
MARVDMARVLMAKLYLTFATSISSKENLVKVLGLALIVSFSRRY